MVVKKKKVIILLITPWVLLSDAESAPNSSFKLPE